MNGRPTGKTTPAQLTLPPGSYRVTVERDGREATQTVDLRGGINYLKMQIGQ